MKTINVVLSPEGVSHAIRELQAYRDSIDRKTKTFVDRLADVGLTEIEATVSSIPSYLGLDHGTASKAKLASFTDRVRMAIRLTSQDVLFIEFSSGITYGTDHYPLDSGKGYGMGTYPNAKGHWNDPNGWYFHDADHPAADADGLVHSYGNPAFMPMYNAREEMAMQAWLVAMEVFGA